MDISKIVEKALKGEDYSAEIASFTDEEKTKVSLAIRDGADAASREALAKVSALRKENERVENKGKENDVVESFKKEQVQKAKSRFFSNPEYPLTDAEKAEFERDFNPKSVDSELVYKEMEKFYAYVKSDDLLANRKKSQELEKNAAEFMAGQAGGTSGGAGGEDESKFSQGAKDLVKAWAKQGIKKSLADAQRIVDRGADWQTSRRLSQ